jgi:pyruvate/2-oxoacid:ferredoxin oxidoreductase beta subunit
VIDYPLNPLSLAIASEATFVARSIDIDVKHLGVMVEAAAKHKGVSFLEVYQNCNILMTARLIISPNGVFDLTRCSISKMESQ